jgi:hypothetical protein
MRLREKVFVLAVAAAVGLCGVAAGKTPPAKAPACGEYGTSVHFEDTPADAARQAKKDEKLVLVLHVSGHFENPQFT